MAEPARSDAGADIDFLAHFTGIHGNSVDIPWTRVRDIIFIRATVLKLGLVNLIGFHGLINFDSLLNEIS